MKKTKKVIVSIFLTLFVLVLITGCQMAIGNNGTTNTSDDSSWNITVKSYSDGIVSEAESAQYRVVASVGNDTLHMHADEDEQEDDIVLAAKQDTVIVALVTC